MSDNKVKFVNGLRAYKPSDKAPTFIKANLTINRNELMMWLNDQGEEIKIDMKESKAGGLYFSVNDFVATESKSKYQQALQEVVTQYPNKVPADFDPGDDLPF